MIHSNKRFKTFQNMTPKRNTQSLFLNEKPLFPLTRTKAKLKNEYSDNNK